MTAAATAPTTLLVRDVMTSPVHTLDPYDFISSAKNLFDRHRFHHAVVIEKGRVVGVVSDRDILKTISPFVGKVMERSQDVSTLRKRVHQILSRHVITARPEDTVTDAAYRMCAEHVSSLPVLDADGALVGIVTARDLLRWFARESTPAPPAAEREGSE